MSQTKIMLEISNNGTEVVKEFDLFGEVFDNVTGEVFGSNEDYKCFLDRIKIRKFLVSKTRICLIEGSDIQLLIPFSINGNLYKFEEIVKRRIDTDIKYTIDLHSKFIFQLYEKTKIQFFLE